MAICKDCGTEFGFFGGSQGRCDECFARHRLRTPDTEQAAADAEAATRERDEMLAKAASVMLTTETAAPDLNITARLGIVTAECAFGMNLFKDIFAVGRDIFGGRSASIQSALKDARNTALDELRLEASKLGANAVIAVDLDYSEISGGGKSMLFLVATGTAVKLG